MRCSGWRSSTLYRRGNYETHSYCADRPNDECQVDAMALSRDSSSQLHEASRKILSVLLNRIEGFRGKSRFRSCSYGLLYVCMLIKPRFLIIKMMKIIIVNPRTNI